MRLPRRSFLRLVAGTAALPVFSWSAAALDYPTRPVRLMVGFFAGGLTDILARVLGQWLSQRLGQQFIVEDQPGAGTNVATETVVRARPDGYTLLMATSSNAINATLYSKLNFDFIRDTVPVASVARTPLVMTVAPSFSAATVPEFIAFAKANPGKINMATAGKGSSVHLAGELFMTMTGVTMTVVHYRESYVPDLLAGRAQVVFSPIPTTIQQNQSRQAARPRGDQRHALAGAAGRPDRRRICTGLRGNRMERGGRAERHARGDRRQAQ